MSTDSSWWRSSGVESRISKAELWLRNACTTIASCQNTGHRSPKSQKSAGKGVFHGNGTSWMCTSTPGATRGTTSMNR